MKWGSYTQVQRARKWKGELEGGMVMAAVGRLD